MTMLCLGVKCWKLAFHLSAVSEVGGEIPNRLLNLNSVWILVLAVGGERMSHCKACVRSVATRFTGVCFACV
jgi:hypothetical protein